jgi:hypothetical protein
MIGIYFVFAITASALAGSLSEGPVETKPSILSKCETIGQNRVCLTIDGSVVLRHESAEEETARFQQIDLLAPEKIRVKDLRCSLQIKPHCLLLGEMNGEYGVSSGRVLALDPATGSSKILKVGQFFFDALEVAGISIVDHASHTPATYVYDVSSQNLKLGRNPPRYGDILGFLPLLNRSNGKIAIARFLIEPKAGKAKIFDQNGEANELSFSRFRSIDLTLLAALNQNATYAFGLMSTFPPGTAKSTVATLFGIRAASTTGQSFQLDYTQWPIELNEGIIQTRAPQVDRNGDMYFVVGGPKGTSVHYICQANTGNLTLKPLFEPSLDARLRVRSSNLLDGTEVIREAPGRQVSFQHFKLEGQGHGLSRQCAGTRVLSDGQIYARAHDLLRKEGDASKEILRVTQLVAPSIPQPALVLHKATNTRPARVLIDVYGAVAGSSFAPNEAITPFDATSDDFWVAQAILPGDGDLGKEFANFGATPNRGATLEALNQLSEELVRRYPTLRGSITLRSMSAGTSTSVQAVLSRPDLYSGAILFSGAYDWRKIAENPNLTGFPSSADQEALDQAIDSVPEYCSGAKFVIIHAENDVIASSSQARSFVDRLKRKKCLVGTAFFGNGGHQLSKLQMAPPEEEAFTRLVRERGSQPLLKDLELAKRLAQDLPSPPPQPSSAPPP